MNKIIRFIPLFLLIGSGCSHKYTYTAGETNPPESLNVNGNTGASTSSSAEELPELKPVETGVMSMVLKATAFKMNGNYSDNVAVTISENGRLAYFPAPTDITPASRPVDLGNGWWLNNQGIGPNSVFTSYTFEDYAKLPAVPSQAEIMAAIIPDSRVTEFVQLPWPASEASSHLDEIIDYLKSN